MNAAPIDRNKALEELQDQFYFFSSSLKTYGYLLGRITGFGKPRGVRMVRESRTSIPWKSMRLSIEAERAHPWSGPSIDFKPLRPWTWLSSANSGILTFLYTLERAKFGVSTYDTFSLDAYLCDVVIAGIKALLVERELDAEEQVELGIQYGPLGFPMGFDDSGNEMTYEKWIDTLHRIMLGFAAHRDILDLRYHTNDRLTKLKTEREEGMALFVEYFGSLWS